MTTKDAGGLAAHAAGLRSRMRTVRFRNALFGFSITIPALAVLGALTAYPLVQTIVLSFYRRELTRPDLGTTFVGFHNFTTIFHLSTFQRTVLNSLLIAGTTTALQILIGFGIALLLNGTFPLRRLMRAAVVLPWAMPTIAAAFVFRWLFDPTFGPINTVLQGLGIIGEPVTWLANGGTALGVVIAAHVWKGIPFVILVFLAGLQSAPRELYEAARVDGANVWQELRFVTLPHMRALIVITLVLRFIWTFNWFDLTFLLTGGGPAGDTRTLPLEVYITAFRTFQLGLASAYAVFMAVLLLVFTLVALRLGWQRERE
jgi:multiple sugar transport system permease protein